MKNIERHGFSPAVSATEYAFDHNLGPAATWGTQVWLEYVRWLCEESLPNAVYLGDTSKVNHPKHYRHRSGMDAIVWIDRYRMDFCEGNCFKYIFRRGEKTGETTTDDEEKAKWYFRHKAMKLAETSLVTWEDAKLLVFNKLSHAFGPAGKNRDGSPDWSVGGCDMPEAVEFLKNECMTLLKD